MSTATANPGTLTVRLDRLFVPENVRELDEEWVEKLQGAIAARGKVTEPIKVIPADPKVHGSGYDYVLVAGFHRVEAARRLGHETIPGVLGDPEYEHTDRASENVVKRSLNPYQEAVAVKRALAEGDSEGQAAAALTMSKSLVTRRVKLLELPDAAQRLVGDGRLTLATVDPMRMLVQANPALLDAVLEFIEVCGAEIAPADFAHTPLSILAAAVEASESDVFAEPLGEVPLKATDLLPNDAPTVALLSKAKELHKQIHRFSYGDPYIRFGDAEVDRARAAGVLLEYGEETPLVTDLDVYRDLCRTAIAAAVETLTQQAAERAKEEESIFGGDGEKTKPAPDDQHTILEKKYRADMRVHAASAHGANLALGDSLKKGLTVVDPDDINVARFFVYGLLSRNHAGAHHSDTVVSAIALCGIRLVVGDFREDKTKILKDKSRGVLRIDYGDGKTHANQTHWLWDYLDGARTAGELYGRALVVIAAEHYASRLVLPASQQTEPLRWPSHNDTALTALTKLAGPHVAETLQALEKAIKTTAREHKKALEALDSDDTEADAEPEATSGAQDATGEQDATDADGLAVARTQAVPLIQGQPGITIPELAARMGVKQNCLYRVLPTLEDEGKVSKQGRGWHAADAETIGEEGAPATLPGLAVDAEEHAGEPEGGSGEQMAAPIDASTLQPPNEGPAPMPDLPDEDLDVEDLPDEVVPDAADVLDAGAEIDF
jgi:ParB/RepB/Spo0J family partition protein